VLRLRLAVLVSLVLLTLACLTAPAAAAEPDGAPCLSSQVGEILSAKLAAHAFDSALPAGWTIQEVGVAGDHIDLGTLDERGHPHSVALRLRGAVAGGFDGQGRWFAFVIEPGGTPIDDSGRRGLLELAARVDAAVPEDEALRVCNRRPPYPAARPALTERGPVLPRWVAPLVATLELVVLGALFFGHRPRDVGRSVDDGRRRLRPLQVAMVTVAIALFAATSLPAIPYDYCDLSYLFSLEDGRWAPQEWMHPLWVPLLDGYRSLLGVFGFHGHMLVPVEVLNVGIAAAALLLLFTLVRRATGDSFLALAAMLTTAACNGFWSASVRPTPYALAFSCLAASLSLLVSDAPVAPRRYAVAGAIAGLAMGLHASAMALGPMALICAMREPDPARTRAKTILRTAAFGAAMITSAFACWALFIARNHITLDYFHNTPLSTAFAGIEQVPGTSIYSSHDPLRQVTQLAGTLLRENTVLFVVAAPMVVLALALRLASVQHPAMTPAERRLTTAAGANLAVLATFFLINNTHNGFIFTSLALTPAALAVYAARLRHGSALFLGLAAIPVIGLAVRAVPGIRGAEGPGARDRILTEVLFLRERLGPNDVVLTPGCPFPEMQYDAPITLIEVRASGVEATSCDVPHACIDHTLRDRVGWWTASGHRVLFALGDDVTDFRGNATGSDNPNGAEKMRQIFWDPRLAPPERALYLTGVRAALDAAGLVLGPVITSSDGERYAEVRPQQTRVAGIPPSGAPFAAAELRAALGDDPILSYRARVLVDMAATLPGDPWAGCDLVQLACEAGVRGAPLCVPIPGCNPCEPPATP
jgi:hypothetical protein